DSSGVLHDRLVNVYTRLGRKAPNAHIIVLDYPPLTDTNNHAGICSLGALWASLDGNERTMASALLTQLNKVIHGAVTNAQIQLKTEWMTDTNEDIDPSDKFAGHELCKDGQVNSGGSYFNEVVSPIFSSDGNTGPLAYTAHPNAYGQRAFEQAIASQVTNFFSTVSPRTETSVGSVFVPYGGRA